VGEVNVDWSKIQELHSSLPFAVVGRDANLGRRSDLSRVPRGTIEVANKTVTLTEPGKPPTTMPVEQAAHIIDEAKFEHDVLHNPRFLEAWTGGITAGASLVHATQQSRVFTGAVNLIRAIPAENWLAARNRTLVNFAAASGLVEQTHTPSVKTEILHADVERDQYFRGKRVFGFALAAFDHNFSQGLELQQSYAGGLGWTAIKESNTMLDLKASVAYTRQSFQETTPPSTNSHNLIGSIFSEAFSRKFGRGILFIQQAAVTPSWNEAHAWSAAGSMALNIPVYKRLSFTIGALDTFLNDPPPGFKKNSFQLTTGLTYSLR